MPEGRLWLADGAVDSPRTLKLTHQTEACLCALQGAGAVRSLHHAFLFVVSALCGLTCPQGLSLHTVRLRRAWNRSRRNARPHCVWYRGSVMRVVNISSSSAMFLCAAGQGPGVVASRALMMKAETILRLEPPPQKRDSISSPCLYSATQQKHGRRGLDPVHTHHTFPHAHRERSCAA
jgi:hypothetical protein